MTVVKGLVAWAERYQDSTLVVTCRVRAFDLSMQNAFGWTVRTLAPFTLGQIRHFLPRWYGEFRLHPEQIDGMVQTILNAIAKQDRLRDMATSPLLLTLMAQIVYNKSRLPEDRPALYESMLELLLGKWDEVRDGEDFATATGLKDWTSARIRLLLDQLSYEAHRTAKSDDGRGRLKRADVRDAMIQYFCQEQFGEETAAQLAVRCLHYIEQRSGLLVPDDNHDYVFAHLTFQEHCAGTYLLTQPNALDLVMQYRQQNLWREPIMLGIGVIQKHNSALVQLILQALIKPHVEHDDHLQAKPPTVWYADLLLAAEIGADRRWQDLKMRGVKTAELRRNLAHGLVKLLNDSDPSLDQTWRLQAGDYLAELGDPRPGVCDLNLQWCDVPAGTYTVGSDDSDLDADDDEKPTQTVTLEGFKITKPLWTESP